jgi:hypothetical protein
LWFVFALLTSFIYAAYYICNQESKLKADIFIIYRGFLTALVATPLALIWHHIFPWQFYAIVVFQGITISYMDYKYFIAFHKFGAENVNAVQPLSVFIIFIFWLIFKPSLLDSYLSAPINSSIIITALIGIVYAVMKYHNQHIGKQCLKEVFPLLLLSASLDVSNKIIMEYSNGYLLALTFHRVAFTGWIIGCINLFFNSKKLSLKELVDLKNIRKGCFIIFLILSMISINFAMYYATNPAYTTAIIYLSVIWIVIINKIFHYFGKGIAYPQIAFRWILLLLFSAIALLLATQN